RDDSQTHTLSPFLGTAARAHRRFPLAPPFSSQSPASLRTHVSSGYELLHTSRGIILAEGIEESGPPLELERESAHRVRRAIVLSGGGARGAYEAGVLRFLLRDLPERLGVAPHFDILSGTSVGALTACWLAATADEGPERAASLEAMWREMRSEDLLRFSAGRVSGWTS